MRQQDALKILKAGRNVFLTGAAGAGKTYLLNQYIDYLKSHKIKPSITASTGIASTHIGGMTIHSWSGIGVKNDLTEWNLDAMEQKQYLVKRITGAEVLIIDEVSMLAPHTLDMVDAVCKHLRRNQRPFGGLQIILSGDFFQLPPVLRGVIEPEQLFANNSKAWKEADIRICYITEQYRQQDNEYNKLLNNIRTGKSLLETKHILEERIGVKLDNDMEPVRLYTHNMNVDKRNMEELDKLTGGIYTYTMTSKGNKNVVANLKKSLLAPETLQLKRGAKVMFVKNSQDKSYVNGTLGEVIDFEFSSPVVKTIDGNEIVVKEEEWVVEDGGKRLASVTQLPLRLAWAITVHKSQGMSLDAAEMDLSATFTPGQGYVALSRLRSLNGLVLLDKLHPTALDMHPYVIELDKYLQKESDKWDVVIQQFDDEELQKMYDNHITQKGGVIKPEESKKDTKSNFLEKARERYPNAYKAWTKKDEWELEEMFTNGRTLQELTEYFGRAKGGIKSRLIKLGLVDEEYIID